VLTCSFNEKCRDEARRQQIEYYWNTRLLPAFGLFPRVLATIPFATQMTINGQLSFSHPYESYSCQARLSFANHLKPPTSFEGVRLLFSINASIDSMQMDLVMFSSSLFKRPMASGFLHRELFMEGTSPFFKGSQRYV